MLASYVEAGFDADAFWRLTPRQYLIQMESFAARRQREHDDAVSAAWLNAAFQRGKKLPKLGDFLHRKTGKADIPAEAKDAKIAAMVREMKRRFQG